MSVREPSVRRWRPPWWVDAAGGYSWRFLVTVGWMTLVVASLIVLRHVVLGVLLAVLLATVVVPVAAWLRRHGASPVVGALAGVLGLLLIGIGAALLVTRSVLSRWDEISAKIDDGERVLLDDTADATGISSEQTADFDSALRDGWDTIGPVLVDGVVSIVSFTVSALGTLMLGLFVLFFLVKDGGDIWRWLVERVARDRAMADRLGRGAWSTLSSYLRGQAIVAAVDAVAIGFGALALGVPFAGAIGVLTFFAAFVPTVGAILSGAVAVFLAAADGGLASAAAMLLVVLVVQQIESNLLQPAIVGKATRLHPLVVFLSITVGALLAGVLGMLLAVPLTAVTVGAVAELRRSGFFAADADLWRSLGRPEMPTASDVAPTEHVHPSPGDA